MNDLTPQRLWQATLGELELKMARATFDTWLRDTHAIGVENEDTLVIGVKNGYAVEWLENRLYPVIKRTLARLTGAEMEARFVVWDARQAESTLPALFVAVDETPHQPPRDPGLNSSYMFESFVVGPSNRLAQAASQAVAGVAGQGLQPPVHPRWRRPWENASPSRHRPSLFPPGFAGDLCHLRDLHQRAN